MTPPQVLQTLSCASNSIVTDTYQICAFDNSDEIGAQAAIRIARCNDWMGAMGPKPL